VALHVGDFSVLRMRDELHDNGGYAPVPGPALQAVQGLREFATTRGWEVAASGAALAALPGDCATQGQREAGAVQLHPPLAGTVKS
jgi:hypothetical protein